MKNQKGITLVALIITIIVMLILAGVSISLVVGENGVLTQAENAGEATERAEAEQAVSLAFADLMMQHYGATTDTDKANVYKSANVKDAIEDNGGKNVTVGDAAAGSYVVTVDTITVNVTLEASSTGALKATSIKAVVPTTAE